MSLLPENYDSSDFEKDSEGSKSYFGLEDHGQSNTIRILGDSSRPETFVMGYSAWREKQKRSAPYTQAGHAEMLSYAELEKITDKNGNEVERKRVINFWLFQIYNITLDTPQVWEVTQKKIRQDLEALNKNPKWGDLKKYNICVTRSGEKGDKKTSYSLIPEAPIEDAPSEEMLFAMHEAKIDCRVIFEDPPRYPMGSLEYEDLDITPKNYKPQTEDDQNSNDIKDIERINKELFGCEPK